MKKILIIIPTLSGGGSERVMLTYAHHLAKNGYLVRVLVINNIGEYELDSSNLFEVEFLNETSVKKAIFKLISHINYYHPDVVFSSLAYLNFAILFIKPFIKNRPIFIVREGNSPSMTYKIRSRKKNMLYKVLYKTLYKRADYVISQCDEMTNELLDTYQINKANIVTIYNPVDIDKVINLYEEFNPFSKYQDKINIVAVGRLVHQKGFDVLIESIALLKISNIQLHILGVGPKKDELMKLTRELGISNKVIFHGFQNNPYPFLRYSDLFVLSSRFEGFPNVLLEALACETKVVATSCKTGTKEIIGENKYGNLAEPEKPEELANAILKSLTGNKKNQKRAMDFTVDKSIEKLINLIEYN